MAMQALETRIKRAAKFDGRYGILVDAGPEGFSTTLRRLLLWQRDEELTSSMARINFPADFDYLPPSWSWMSYDGPIDYMDIPYGDVDWESNNIEMSFRDSLHHEQTLNAPAWIYRQNVAVSGRAIFVYDAPHVAELGEERCIILGRSKGEYDGQRRCYVLLVSDGATSGPAWLSRRRVGVADMAQSDILLSQPPLQVVVF
jgi:hypothetical protein